MRSCLSRLLGPNRSKFKHAQVSVSMKLTPLNKSCREHVAHSVFVESWPNQPRRKGAHAKMNTRSLMVTPLSPKSAFQCMPHIHLFN